MMLHLTRADGLTASTSTRSWRTFVGGLCAALVAFGLIGATIAADHADAVTVRSGARALQVDVLLDGVETQRAASSAWGSATTCWSVATAGASSAGWAGRLLVGRWVAAGAVGGVAGGLACVSVVTTCAAQAYLARPRRWAGMTITPTGFWCWKY
jgi:hypothetical protein